MTAPLVTEPYAGYVGQRLTDTDMYELMALDVTIAHQVGHAFFRPIFAGEIQDATGLRPDDLVHISWCGHELQYRLVRPEPAPTAERCA